MKQPLDVLDLKTNKMHFYKIHLYDIETEKVKNEEFENINNFKTNYLIQFLNKEITYEEDNCVNVKATMIIYLIKEKEEIIKLKVQYFFLMIFKNNLKSFKEKEDVNVINYHIKIRVYDILLFNDYYINNEIKFTII